MATVGEYAGFVLSVAFLVAVIILLMRDNRRMKQRIDEDSRP